MTARFKLTFKTKQGGTNSITYIDSSFNIPTNIAYSTTFSGSGEFSGTDGWTGTTGKLQLQSGGLAVIASGAGVYLHTAPSGGNYDLTATYNAPLANDGTSSYRVIYSRYTDANNYISLAFQCNSGFVLTKKVGGTSTSLSSFVNQQLNNGDKVTLRVIGNYAHILLNGTELSGSIAANGGLGYDVTNVPVGASFGIQGASAVGNSSFPFLILTGISVKTYPANTINITSVTDTNSLASGSGVTPVISGSITGTVTQLQYALANPVNGQILQNWTNISGLSNGVISATLPNSISNSQAGKTITVYLRDGANASDITSYAFNVPARQTVYSARFGIQDAVYSSYVPSDYARDKGHRFDVRLGSSYNYVMNAPGGIGGFDTNGNINSYPAGETSLRYIFQWYFAQLGTYTLAYPNGMTCTPSGSSSEFGSEYVIDANTKGRKVIISTNFNSIEQSVIFSGTPTGKTSTTMAFRPTLIYDGDTSSQLTSDAFISSLKALNTKIFRSMDARGVNGTIAVQNAGTINTYRNMSLPMLVDTCNQAGADLWLNFYCNQDDASVKVECDYVAANLNPGLKLYIEYVNENWNTSFSQWEETAVLGMQMGFHNSTTSSGATPLGNLYRGTNFSTVSVPSRNIAVGEQFASATTGYQTVYTASVALTSGDITARLPTASNTNWTLSIASNAATVSGLQTISGNFTVTGSVPNRTFSTGDMVSFNLSGTGVQVWKALQNINAFDPNAAITPASTAYWAVLNTNADTSLARVRWCSYRTAQIATIANASFQAVSRATSAILPVFAWISVSAVTDTAGVSTALDFDNNYNIFKRFAVAPYWSRFSPYVMVNYASGDFGTWTSANKQLYLTDIPSCVTAFFNAANAAIDNAIDVARTRKNEIAAYSISRGLSVDAIQLCFYEWGCHFDPQGDWTNSTQLSALKTAIFSDPRMGVADQRYIARWQANVGGDGCYYARIGYNTTDYTWHIQNGEIDRTSAQMASVISANATIGTLNFSNSANSGLYALLMDDF